MFPASGKVTEEVEAFIMGESMALMGCRPLDLAQWGQGSDWDSEWMDFMVTVVSSGVITGHVVSIGSLDRLGRHLTRSVWSGCGLKLL